MIGNNYHHHQIKEEAIEEDEYNNTMTSSQLFKSNFLESNQGWNQQQTPPESFALSPSPIYDSFNHYEEDEDNILAAITSKHNQNRVHSRHFSANDSHCIRNNNSSYLASPSSSTFLLQQQQNTHSSNTQNIPQLHATSSDESNLLPPQRQSIEIDKQKQQQRRLRFDIVLEAATAVTQKAEESAITYLNRGQVYGIQLNDKQGLNEIVTSTLSIAFHSSSHRRIAESYWKFWVSQQKQSEARAIDIDASQSTGISDLKFPSFDKITFNWNGRFGAKIYVRFKCLSTDFSRIKGVKGIPLRTQMESHVTANELTGSPTVDEICFCKVKLFRDKGAERKNKDDAKQISKQLEKVYGKANEQSLPLMYNVSLPYSVFGEIPTSSTLDSFEHAADDTALPLQTKTPARYHTRVMTAPNSLFYRSSNNRRVNGRERKSISSVLPPYSPMISQQQQRENACGSLSPVALGSAASLTSTAPLSGDFKPTTKENYDFHRYLTQQQQALAALPAIDTNILRHKNSKLHSSSSCSSILQQQEYSNNINNATSFDDDMPPLTADTAALQTPGTAQVTPTDFSHHGAFERKLFLNSTIFAPDLMTDSQIYHHQQQQQQNSNMLSSIYDVFTPEEIQQPLEACSITPTPTREEFFGSTSPQTTEFTNNHYQSQQIYHQRDYFCSMEPSTSSSHISLLQQQLQLHNETASNIILNSNSVSNMLLLSPPPPPNGNNNATKSGSSHNKRGGSKNTSSRKKKRVRSETVDNQDDGDMATLANDNRILTYSSNPSHITLSTTTSAASSASSISSHCSINSDSSPINNTFKKIRYDLSP